MSRTSILKRSLSATTAVAIFAALLSPANATYRQIPSPFSTMCRSAPSQIVRRPC
jgi:hypothetical protein